MPRRRRGFPCFPYTPLFRSELATPRIELDDLHFELFADREELSQLGAARRARCGCADEAARIAARRTEHADDEPARDRKSTRLNSSHVESSYAVFCLKKKTT